MKKILFLLFVAISLTGLGQTKQAVPDPGFKQLFDTVTNQWLCADANYSIQLPDGSSLWLFGDTFLGDLDENGSIMPGFQFIRNSVIHQTTDERIGLYSGSFSTGASDFFPTNDDTWYWPAHGITLNDTLIIFLERYKHEESGTPGFDFVYDGTDLAYMSPITLEIYFIDSIGFSYVNKDIRFGNQILSDDDGYIYIYGRKDEYWGTARYAAPVVARVENDFKGNWEFWGSGIWNSECQYTTTISENACSEQFSVITYGDEYILITQETWLGKKIFATNSPNAFGPFTSSNQILIYETPESYFTYNTWAHIQYIENDNLLISYNVNGGWDSIVNDADQYRARFLRIPMNELTGMQEVASENNLFECYPVPCSSKINIRAYSLDTYTLTLRNLKGFSLFKTEITTFVSLPVHTLPKGVYFLTLESENNIETKRILIL